MADRLGAKMEILVKNEIVNELSFTISTLASENNLPSVLDKLSQAASGRYGRSITIDLDDAKELARWIKRDLDYKREVVLGQCLDDGDKSAAQSVRRYLIKCETLLRELTNA